MTRVMAKSTILEELAAAARRRVEESKARCPFAEVRTRAETVAEAAVAQESLCEGKADVHMRAGRHLPFEQALAAPGMSFICEVKKASPSKGVIAEDFPYLEIAREYELAGAAAVSVLTEPTRFLGSDEYLREIAAALHIPALRKDFTVDAYQVYEAKTLGAAAVLLICALLTESQLREFITIADGLGLSCLVEAHDEREVAAALAAGARLVGVNNRNLHTFEVDLAVSERLRQLVPDDIIFVAESGIHTADDIRRLKDIGADAVLIGESLMRAEDKKAALDSLRGKS